MSSNVGIVELPVWLQISPFYTSSAVYLGAKSQMDAAGWKARYLGGLGFRLPRRTHRINSGIYSFTTFVLHSVQPGQHRLAATGDQAVNPFLI